MVSLFISKDDIPARFKEFCERDGFALINKSCIGVKPVPFVLPDLADFEIVFFTSPNCVNFFFASVSSQLNKTYACIGQRTAEELLKYGVHCAFIGEKSGLPTDVALAFSSFIGNRNVLFPQSTVSKQTIQQFIPKKQVISLVIYETIAKPFKLVHSAPPQILVFTSPSNFESFLLTNTINSGQEIIAWGTTTAGSIMAKGFHVNRTMQESSFDELMKLLHNKKGQ